MNRHPVNPHICNPFFARMYINLRRKNSRISRLLELVLNTEIRSNIPQVLFMPHPYGIIVGRGVRLGEVCTIMHQVTLGGKNPLLENINFDGQYPIVGDNVYIGAGAKVLGGITLGGGRYYWGKFCDY